jgi:two-component system NarL family sensor kinase
MQNQFPEIVIQLVVSIFIGLLLIGFIIVLFQLSKKKRLLQEKELLALKTAYANELLTTQLEIQENVMKAISMEIHDNIGQIMLLANVNISILQAMDLPVEAPDLITDTKKMLSKASEDISQLSRSLHSDRISQIGVFQELTQLANKNLFGVAISGPQDLSGTSLPKETQLLVFRMFQEISNNIIKHSKATQVSFSILEKTNGLEMVISDNGIGFDFSQSSGGNTPTNGVGMRSLHSRAQLFGGKFSVETVLNKGTNISIFIPDTNT